MSRPPLHALQAFVAIARTRNLTRAATQLNLTVSALSHQMRALEERMNQRLLLRGPRGVTLTPQGERIWKRLMQVIERRNAEIMSCLNASEVEHFSVLLDRLVEHARRTNPGTEVIEP